MPAHGGEGGGSGILMDNSESSVISEPAVTLGTDRVTDMSLVIETEKISGDLRLSGEAKGALLAL